MPVRPGGRIKHLASSNFVPHRHCVRRAMNRGESSPLQQPRRLVAHEGYAVQRRGAAVVREHGADGARPLPQDAAEPSLEEAAAAKPYLFHLSCAIPYHTVVLPRRVLFFAHLAPASRRFALVAFLALEPTPHNPCRPRSQVSSGRTGRMRSAVSARRAPGKAMRSPPRACAGRGSEPTSLDLASMLRDSLVPQT